MYRATSLHERLPMLACYTHKQMLFNQNVGVLLSFATREKETLFEAMYKAKEINYDTQCA